MPDSVDPKIEPMASELRAVGWLVLRAGPIGSDFSKMGMGRGRHPPARLITTYAQRSSASVALGPEARAA